MLDQRGVIAGIEATRKPQGNLLRLAGAGGLLGLRGGRGGRRGRGLDGGRRRHDRGLLRLLLLVLVVALAGKRVLELAHAPAHGAAHFRKPLRPEHEQQDEEKEKDLPDSEILETCDWHAARIAAPRKAGRSLRLGRR